MIALLVGVAAMVETGAPAGVAAMVTLAAVGSCGHRRHG